MIDAGQQLSVDTLPVDTVLKDVKEALSRFRGAVIQAPPGSGKTTHVPIALLGEKWLQGKRIVMLDGLKGTLPVYTANLIVGMTGERGWNDLAVTATALAAFCGHLYPVYMTGKHGGKGVATAFGCFLVISPAATGICMLIYVAGLLLSAGKSSVGSLLAAASLPVVLCFFRPSPVVIIGSVFMMVMIFFRHQDNIRRLINGTEPSL